MSAKIVPLIVSGLLLGTTALASAQTRNYYQQDRQGYADPVAPKRGMHWRDPYAGTVWEGIAPYGSNIEPNPYAGTIWDGVAPY